MNIPPEHLHAMLNHIPLVGTGIIALLALYALLLGERHTLAFAGGLAVVVALVAATVVWAGEEGMRRFQEGGPLADLLDSAGRDWIEMHEQRGEIAALASYITGGTGLIALLAAVLSRKWRRPAAALLLVAALTTVALGAWAADAGGKIRHPEFRRDMLSTDSPAARFACPVRPINQQGRATKPIVPPFEFRVSSFEFPLRSSRSAWRS